MTPSTSVTSRNHHCCSRSRRFVPKCLRDRSSWGPPEGRPSHGTIRTPPLRKITVNQISVNSNQANHHNRQFGLLRIKNWLRARKKFPICSTGAQLVFEFQTKRPKSNIQAKQIAVKSTGHDRNRWDRIEFGVYLEESGENVRVGVGQQNEGEESGEAAVPNGWTHPR